MRPNIRNTYLLIIMVLATIMVFWKMGVTDVNDWDEARNGVNAYEMYHNKDLVNLYYAGAPDTWNAKPPLLTWLIVICYKLFGFNEFALRLPSAISTVIFFLFFFKLVELLEGYAKAFMCCLVLLSCKAILGTHVGITGDYDALLVCLLTMSAYYFIRYTDLDEPNAVYMVALFTGIAFYTKGTASLVYLPGFVLYLLYKKQLVRFFMRRSTWMAALLFICIVASWMVLVSVYGRYGDTSHYGSTNSVETMLVHDTFRRLTSTGFEKEYLPDHFFVFSTLDTRLNVWNYLFYISILTGLFLLYKHRGDFWAFVQRPSNRLTVFSLFVASPLCITLTLAANTHSWYLAPALAFIVFIIVKGCMYLASKWRPFFAICCCLFLFTFVRQFLFLDSRSRQLHDLFSMKNASFKKCNKVVVLNTQPPQRVLLYLQWLQVPIQKCDTISAGQVGDKTILLLSNDAADKLTTIHIKKISTFDDRCVAAAVK